MGAYLASCFCCCCCACASQCKEALAKLVGGQRLTKISYFLLLVVFLLPSIFIFFFLYNWVAFQQFFSKWLSCPNSDNFACIGASVIYRLSLSLVGLFFVLMIFMICRNKCAQVINEGFFFVKYFFIVALVIGFLFVPNYIFQNYASAANYLSIIFMLLQSIILIDLFYLAGIRLVRKYDQGSNSTGILLIVLSIIIQAIAIFMNILGYTQFSQNLSSSCSSTLWVNIVTSVIIVLLPILQLFHFNQQNSLLTTSLVTLYISYLNLIAQYSAPNCSRLTVGALVADISVSVFFFVLTMYGSIMGGSGQVKVTDGGDINKAIGVAVQQPASNPNQIYRQKPMERIQTDQHLRNQAIDKEIQTSEQEKYHSWSWVKWHFYMVLASIYLSVLISDWNSVSIITGNLDANAFSFWVRVAISWATTLIYIWTLIAPRILPTRDFVV